MDRHAWDDRGQAVVGGKGARGGVEVDWGRRVVCAGCGSSSTTKKEIMLGESGGDVRAGGWWCRRCCTGTETEGK